MTQPAQAKRRGYGPRKYAWPPLPPHEFEVISVTSALDAGMAKPYLIGWAAKKTAERAVDKYELLARLIKEDGEQGAIDWLKRARFADSAAKAKRGDVVHAALEAYLAGRPADKATIEAHLKKDRVPVNLWKSAAAMVSGLMEFLYDEEPEVYWSEATVYSREHGYAGTADVIARMRIGGTPRPVVIDVKTSREIYNETAFQLSGYARADFVGLDDGSELPLVPTGEAIDYGVVVRPTASGKYEKAVFALTPDVQEVFLACVTVASKKDVVDGIRRPS